MNIAITLAAQTLLLHVVFGALATYCFIKLHAPVKPTEKWLIGICWMLPLLGPILIGLYTVYFSILGAIRK